MRNTHHGQWAAALGTAVALCGTLAAAQAPTTTPQGTKPTTGASATQHAGQVTATGCLQRGSSATGSTTSATSTPGSADSATTGSTGGFVLKNAKIGGAASGAGSSDASGRSEAGAPRSSTESTGSTPTGGAQAGNTPSSSGSMAGGAGGAREIRLSADASVNLAEHVGHQVMVTGHMGGSSPMSNSAARSGSASGESSSAGSPSAGGSTASPQSGSSRDLASGTARGSSMVVTKVSMISATCTAGS